jgi:internalin A
MATRHYVFKNSGELINNDVVLPGQPYILNGYSYHFWIRPKTKFWRFGIRLSKTEAIKFYHPEHRYKSPEFQENYIDIHLGVGDWNNAEWFYPNKLQLTQYNIPSEKDHILSGSTEYQEKGEIEWKIQGNSVTKDLDISYASLPNISVIKKVTITDEYKYFSVFVWADKTDFEVECQLQTMSLQEFTDNDSEITAIKVGNVIFREGDMFDGDALQNANLILLPASSDGSASSNILNRASELGIPYPEKSKPGAILTYSVSHRENLLAGYAYSVDRTKSNSQIISDIASSLVEANLANNLGKQIRKAINIPLFGTGAGGLKHFQVAEIYDQEFNRFGDSPEVIVSIPSTKIFKEIQQLFLGRFLPIKQSKPKLKPAEILRLEKELNIEVNTSAYNLSNNQQIDYLNLDNYKFNAIHLMNFPEIGTLSLNNSEVENISELSGLKKLHTLYFSSTHLKDYRFLKKLKNLQKLDLSLNNLDRIDFLDGLKNLKALYLKGNFIRTIGQLMNLRKLEILDLSDNDIGDIDFLSGLTNLKNLNLARNNISTIMVLAEHHKLQILDISSNRIENINFIIDLPALKHLKADKNPFLERLQLILSENENHLPPIRNLLSRQAENGAVELILPAKVLLLGNHASGKSSLLGFIHFKHLRRSTNSTHIIKIEKFPWNSSEMPQAIFFDFGGQDYYHGIYRAFLSSGSIYLILWNREYNNNKQRIDRNGVLTQNFSLQYWLSQKKYLETEKYDGKIDPVLLIQSHSDLDKRESFHDSLIKYDIENEFYVSLRQTSRRDETSAHHLLNDQALKYLNASIQELIRQRQIRRNEPIWFVNFLLYILNQDPENGHIAKNVSREVLPHYEREGVDNLTFLRDDLDQLHKQGLILYYKKEFPDIVWLNPAALAKYVHDFVLNKEVVKTHKGRVPYADFGVPDQEIVKLLHLQKVIFLHEFGENGQEYIVPNFLPLTTEDNSTFDLFTFGLGQPIFTLKFLHFLPFGLINQIICFFGSQQDKKKFWRDQLLFTLEGKAKVLIRLDFQKLEIKTYATYLKQLNEPDKTNMKKYIFYGILGLYWDMELLAFSDFVAYVNNEIKKEEITEDHRLFDKIMQYDNLFQNSACRPVDMYISLDEENFVNYSDLYREENTVEINAIQLEGHRSNKTIPIFPFQLFTNRVLRKRKKVAISYSKKDLVLVNKFIDYLIPLFEDELIEKPWYCTKLIAGSEWDEEIRKKFEEADIIFFMISENLMGTKYVKENEIKNSIDRWNLNKSIKIIPILLVHYHFARKGPYDLSKFSALPYTLKPVTDFPDHHIAWHLISESIRLIIENDWDPGTNDGSLTPEQRDIYERIVEKRLR